MRLKFSREIEQVIKYGSVSIIANSIDEAVLNGSGSSFISLGILNTSGIESLAGSINRLTATLFDFINLKKDVYIDNVYTSKMTYLTNSTEGVLYKFLTAK
tara:strand:- start:269 stop:571 length:303 start_codon:yes stop_codon:yes gene_type:complete